MFESALEYLFNALDCQSAHVLFFHIFAVASILNDSIFDIRIFLT